MRGRPEDTPHCPSPAGVEKHHTTAGHALPAGSLPPSPARGHTWLLLYSRHKVDVTQLQSEAKMATTRQSEMQRGSSPGGRRGLRLEGPGAAMTGRDNRRPKQDLALKYGFFLFCLTVVR